jgi:exodeoxyribonuclease VIII
MSPSSTSWGSQVRVLYRPYDGTTTVEEAESNQDYHSSAGWSKSQLWDFISRGPRYFYLRHVAKSIKPEESAALSHGTLLHRWFEVGESFWDELVVPPAKLLTDTGRVGKAAKEWLAEHAAGKSPVSQSELDQLRCEADAIMAHAAARDLIAAKLASEVSIRWLHEDGTLLRCRPDMISEDLLGPIVVDLKTTREADVLGSWWRSVMDYGYHAQDAHYQWGMEAVGMDARPLVFVVVSTVAPHDVAVVNLPSELVDSGRARMRSAIADIGVRMSIDCWMPEQHGEVVELPVPGHVLRNLP